MSKEEAMARKHCCNYGADGLCLGVMMKADSKAGYITKVKTWINSDMATKPCKTMVKECKYFKHIVVPIMGEQL